LFYAFEKSFIFEKKCDFDYFYSLYVFSFSDFPNFLFLQATKGYFSVILRREGKTNHRCEEANAHSYTVMKLMLRLLNGTAAGMSVGCR